MMPSVLSVLMGENTSTEIKALYHKRMNSIRDEASDVNSDPSLSTDDKLVILHGLAVSKQILTIAFRIAYRNAVIRESGDCHES